MNKKDTNNISLVIFKSIIYMLLYLIFVFMFSRVNYALLKITRTSVITAVAFFGSLIVMQSIYGGLQIGEEKSKPIILSTSISIFFVDIISLLVLYIMGINEFSFKTIISKYLLLLLIVYILQIIITSALVHLGNYFYFKVNKPQNIMLIHDDGDSRFVIENHINSYDKQYKLIDKYDIHENKFINLENVDKVFLVVDGEERNKIIKECILKDVNLVYKANIADVAFNNADYQVIDDILMVNLQSFNTNFIQDVLKRMIDILISLIALIITLPIMLLVAIAIKLDDGGSVFYRQERLTKDGKIFKIIKFRSMKENNSNEPVKVNDSRITKTGKFIRNYRIDELPQFYNILKGDMSVVGPRPESLVQFEQILEEVPEFNQRLKVKGGLTGYAQIFGKYNTTPKQKLILDIKYIYSFSIFEDIKLIFQTLIVFFKKDSTEAFNQ